MPDRSIDIVLRARDEASGVLDSTSGHMVNSFLHLYGATYALRAGFTGLTAASSFLRGDMEGLDKAMEGLPRGLGEIYSVSKAVIGEFTGWTREIKRVKEEAASFKAFMDGMAKAAATSAELRFRVLVTGMPEAAAHIEEIHKALRDKTKEITAAAKEAAEKEQVANQAQMNNYSPQFKGLSSIPAMLLFRYMKPAEGFHAPTPAWNTPQVTGAIKDAKEAAAAQIKDLQDKASAAQGVTIAGIDKAIRPKPTTPLAEKIQGLRDEADARKKTLEDEAKNATSVDVIQRAKEAKGRVWLAFLRDKADAEKQDAKESAETVTEMMAHINGLGVEGFARERLAENEQFRQKREKYKGQTNELVAAAKEHAANMADINKRAAREELDNQNRLRDEMAGIVLRGHNKELYDFGRHLEDLRREAMKKGDYRAMQEIDNLETAGAKRLGAEDLGRRDYSWRSSRFLTGAPGAAADPMLAKTTTLVDVLKQVHTVMQEVRDRMTPPVLLAEAG